jgi:putative nucleotidyltransferase with HDIG domain
MANVLLVGEERERTADVGSILALDGHRVAIAREVSRWPEDEKSGSPDVVVAAVENPDGVLSAPAGRARGFAPPILFVHRESDDPRDPHMDTRVVDRIASPFAAEELLGRVDALVRVRRVVMHRNSREDDGATPGRGRWSAGLAALLRARVPRREKPKASYLEVAARVAEWSDRRDGFEPGHAERVTNFAAMIADEFDLADGETAALLRAAMLHDIGKVALPAEVLRHKGPLGENQIRLIRTHAERGAAILRALDKDEVVADTILHHHEHVDGSGYYGRTGTTIPRASRILAVAEAFDAMTTSLVRKRLTPDGALGLLRDRRGGQWDGECVDALVSALKPAPSAFSLV